MREQQIEYYIFPINQPSRTKIDRRVQVNYIICCTMWVLECILIVSINDRANGKKNKFIVSLSSLYPLCLFFESDSSLMGNMDIHLRLANIDGLLLLVRQSFWRSKFSFTRYIVDEFVGPSGEEEREEWS